MRSQAKKQDSKIAALSKVNLNLKVSPQAQKVMCHQLQTAILHFATLPLAALQIAAWQMAAMQLGAFKTAALQTACIADLAF